MILDQRSELEHYFIEEIQQAQQKVGQDLTQKIRIKDEITKKHGSTKDAISMVKDLMQFRWSERQEVIEKVFAKINSGNPPLYWRELDTEDIRKSIIEEQEREAQMRRGEIPDDSEAQRTLEKGIENP